MPCGNKSFVLYCKGKREVKARMDVQGADLWSSVFVHSVNTGIR